jgi:hypothetical protein
MIYERLLFVEEAMICMSCGSLVFAYQIDDKTGVQMHDEWHASLEDQ